MWSVGVVGIATRYELDGPGIEIRWGRDFPYRPDRPWDPPSLLYNGYRVSFSGVKRPGRGTDRPLPYSARLEIGWTPPSRLCVCIGLLWTDLSLVIYIIQGDLSHMHMEVTLTLTVSAVHSLRLPLVTLIVLPTEAQGRFAHPVQYIHLLPRLSSSPVVGTRL
jgi:hypothetical protein